MAVPPRLRILFGVSESLSESSKGLLPLIVGVTGHRDLAPDEHSATERCVQGVFADLQTAYPHTPIVLLSSLAEGADRLVAHAALDCGAELFVVLPMETELYEEDFASADSVEEFRRLMSRSCGCTIVETPAAERDQRYAAAGAFVVSHSEILIALWDGNEDEMPGGTSQIVRFALQGVPADFAIGSQETLHTTETGAVCHIPVRRQSGSTQQRTVLQVTWRHPEPDATEPSATNGAPSAFEENLRNLDRFNRDAAAATLAEARVRGAALLTADQEAALGIRGVLQYTRTLFGQADVVALKCRNWTHRATVAIFFAIAVATVIFSLYTNLFAEVSALYFAFLGVVSVAIGIDLIVIRKRMQDRFQDYRALAEGLRVQFYWRLAGISESVYDYYFARQKGELDWIRSAMRAEAFRSQRKPDLDANSTRLRRLLEAVLTQWISGEGAYFAKAVGRERELASRIKLGANACLVVTVAVTILLGFTITRGNFAYQGILIAILTIALAGAGLFTGYAQKRAHEEHARRYRRMAALYRVAGDRMTMLLQRGDISAARAVLLQLGREALAETCDWLLLHRERQIEVPTA